jgi:hypothetical protein
MTRLPLVPVAIAGAAILVVAVAVVVYLGAGSASSRSGAELPTGESPIPQAEAPRGATSGRDAAAPSSAPAKPPTILPSAKPSWREFKSDIGRFKVQMPGEVTSLPNQFLAAIPPGTNFVITYSDHHLHADSTTFTDVLENSRDGKIAAGYTLVTDKQIAAGNYQGREFVFDGMPVKIYERHIVAGQRWYALKVSIPTTIGVRDDPASVQKFFASFEIKP